MRDFRRRADLPHRPPYSRCKECEKRVRRGRHVRRRRWTAFKLTEADYEALVVSQAGRCAACGAPDPDPSTCLPTDGLHIDHDHTTGRVRGLLCSGCNRAAGHAGDDPVRLRQVAAYLEAA